MDITQSETIDVDVMMTMQVKKIAPNFKPIFDEMMWINA
jgi:hypothetical protein